MRLVFGLVLLLALGPTIKVTPSVVSGGDNIAVSCRVPQSADNRLVVLGIEDWTSSERSMDGDAAPILYEQVFRDIPCDLDSAFCKVTKSNGKSTQVTAKFTVSCQ